MKLVEALHGLAKQFREDPELRCCVRSAACSVLLVGLAGSFLLHHGGLPSGPYYVLALFGTVTCATAASVAIFGRQSPLNSVQASLLGSVFGASLLHLVDIFEFGAKNGDFGAKNGDFGANFVTCKLLASYAAAMAFFHYSEYLVRALTNRYDLNNSSYLLDHSVHYWLAAALSWFEFGTESFFLPAIKSLPVAYFGLFLVTCGELIRKLAMFQAGIAFTHNIKVYRRAQHRLVTHGLYGYVRHPGYLGWFLWALGTQIVLCNPVCLLLYTAVVWLYFDERIRTEEQLLLLMFGDEYAVYQRMVPAAGIPFIRGFQ